MLQSYHALLCVAITYIPSFFPSNVKCPVQNIFSNSNSAVRVKYLMSPNYYIQIKKNWYYINVYTTIKGYLAVAWWFLPVNYNNSRSRNMIATSWHRQYNWNLWYISDVYFYCRIFILYHIAILFQRIMIRSNCIQFC
jgi:hypothetical protein